MVKTDTQDARPDFLVNIVGKIPEMARPVMIWLHAVKHRRPDLLQQAFSSRVKRRPKFQSRTWEETLLYFDRLWREKFGNWDTSDFHFYGISQREGEPNRGSVLVKYEPEGRTAQTTQVAVVREGDQWFVDRW